MARNISGLRRGGPGRHKGIPNKATKDVQAAARAFLDNPKGRAAMKLQYELGTLPPAIWQLFMHYAYGKPRDTLTIDGELPAFIVKLETDDPTE